MHRGVWRGVRPASDANPQKAESLPLIKARPKRFYITFWGYVKFARANLGERERATYPPVMRSERP